MGIAFISKGSNFASIAVAQLGIFTTVSAGLLALHELRLDNATALKNRGSSGNASVTGSPSYNTQRAIISSTNRMTFGTKPSGSHTFAAIIKSRAGTVTTSLPVGSYATATTTTGNEYLAITTAGIQLNARPFNSGGVAQSSIATTLAKPATDRAELYVARLTNESGQKLENPRTATSATSSTAFTYNYPNPNFYAASILDLASAADEVSLFAHWDRVLTDVEVATFYTEMQAYFGNRGLVI